MDAKSERRRGYRSLTEELSLKRLRVLLIDDDELDQLKVKRLLQRGRVGSFDLEWQPSFEDGRDRLLNNEHDICLLDYRIGPDDGLDLLEEAAAVRCTVPIVVMTGVGDYQVDMAAMQRGAADYLSKDELSAPLLERAIRYAIRDRRMKQELERLAFTDELTGLHNRRTFLDRFEHALSRCRRNDAMLAVLLLDLDQFKAINDQLGHQAGDEALRQIAGRMKSVVREMDTVARIGGDEFVVLLEDLQQSQQATRVANKIIARLAERPLRLEQRLRQVSASIGVAVFRGAVHRPDETSVDMLLSRADDALYRAKEEGGGRVVLAPSKRTATLTERPADASLPANG